LKLRTALLGLFVALTIVLASTTVYESGRTMLTSTSTLTSTVTSVSTVTTTTAQTTTVTTTFDPTQAITDAYLSHIGAIESRNATDLAAEYVTNATLRYTLSYAGLNGTAYGIANITRVYLEPTNKSQAVSCVTCFALTAPYTMYAVNRTFAAANDTHSIMVSNDETKANVTSHLVFYGTNSGCYNPSAGLDCQTSYYAMVFDISYVLQGSRWLISMESLTYVGGSVCTTAYTSSDGSVFHCEFASA
jgi:hypothetical protein